MSKEILETAVATVLVDAHHVSPEENQNWLPLEDHNLLSEIVAGCQRGITKTVLEYALSHSLIPLSVFARPNEDSESYDGAIKNRVQAINNQKLRNSQLGYTLVKVSQQPYVALVPTSAQRLVVHTERSLPEITEHVAWLVHLFDVYTLESRQTGQVIYESLVPGLLQILQDKELRYMHHDSIDQSMFADLNKRVSTLLFGVEDELDLYLSFYFTRQFAGIETSYTPSTTNLVEIDKFVVFKQGIDERYQKQLEDITDVPKAIRNFFFGRYGSRYIFTDAERELLFYLVEAFQKDPDSVNLFEDRFFNMKDDPAEDIEGALRVRLVGIRKKLRSFHQELSDKYGYHISIVGDRQHGYRLDIRRDTSARETQP